MKKVKRDPKVKAINDIAVRISVCMQNFDMPREEVLAVVLEQQTKHTAFVEAELNALDAGRYVATSACLH